MGGSLVLLVSRGIRLSGPLVLVCFPGVLCFTLTKLVLHVLRKEIGAVFIYIYIYTYTYIYIYIHTPNFNIPDVLKP